MEMEALATWPVVEEEMESEEALEVALGALKAMAEVKANHESESSVARESAPTQEDEARGAAAVARGMVVVKEWAEEEEMG